MKIVICGSVHFASKMREVGRQLAEKGHIVVLPHSILKYNLISCDDVQKMKERSDFIAKEKPYFTKRHFDEITRSDAIFVVNDEKNGVPGYIGGATFAEIMIAFYNKKKIFLLNPIPKHEKLALLKDELECVQPVITNGNIDMVQ